MRSIFVFNKKIEILGTRGLMGTLQRPYYVDGLCNYVLYIDLEQVS